MRARGCTGRVQPTRAELRWIVAGVSTLGLAVTVGIALAPLLLTYSPLLLIALAPLGRHLVVAAPITDFVPFLLVATARRMLTCTLAYFVGAAYGEAGLAWVEQRYARTGRFVRWGERLFRRAGPLVIVVAPGPPLCALAGLTRMRLAVFLPLATLGQVAWICISYRVGEALSAWVLPLLEVLREHVFVATVACVLLVMLYRVLRARRQPALPPLQDVSATGPVSGGGEP